jgi:hypothetical protein
MNFPVGQVLKKGELPTAVSKVIQELSSSSFSGYIIQSIKSWCVQEGVLFFRDGKVVASVVECILAQQILKSNEALSEFLNQTNAKGYYQVVELSRSQVDLITAFDEKILFAGEIALKDVTKLIPNKFTERFAVGELREDVFEAYGLGALK